MKAIRVHAAGPPEVMKYEDVPDPKPGAGEILVKVHAAGVNPVDTYIRAGTGSYAPRALPYTPGMDAAGIVEAVGEGVTKVKPGDRVYTAGSVSGTYAEKTLCKEIHVYPLPPNISFAQGAGVYCPYATAWRALFQRAKAVPGEIVLVHGASGGVGTAAVQIAGSSGFKVVGTGGTEKGRAHIAAQGAHHVLDHKSPGYLDEAMALTGGRGFDVILEMLANVNLEKDLKLLATGGRVVVIGSRGRIEIDPRDIMARAASVLGMILMFTPESEKAAIHAAIGAGLENGTFRPVVGREFSLADAPTAHIAVMEPGALGKIVLLPV